MENYEQFTDEELIERLRDGEQELEDYLMEKYKGMVLKKAHAMFIVGGEREDLIQEGMIGLFKALIRQHLSSFETQVLDSYLEGMTYTQIAEAMEKSPKSIDNALQRIRGKIREFLE